MPTNPNPSPEKVIVMTEKCNICQGPVCEKCGGCLSHFDCTCNSVSAELSEARRERPQPVEIVGNHWIHRDHSDSDAQFYRREEVDRLLGSLEVELAALKAQPDGDEVCGQSEISASLGFSPTRTGGCGETIRAAKVYRCAECSIPFHQHCIRKHFGKHEPAQPDGWIEVTERLPMDGDDVLAWDKIQVVQAIYRADSIKYRWDCDTFGLGEGEVTHWRPLPTPPVREKEGREGIGGENG